MPTNNNEWDVNEFMRNVFGNDFQNLNDTPKQTTIQDIADRYRDVLVKCPCCNHTIKFKIKV